MRNHCRSVDVDRVVDHCAPCAVTANNLQVASLQETPATGCVHPLHPEVFDSATAYMEWYTRKGPLRGAGAPVVAVLLYRKHVITKQPYIAQLITCLEDQVGIIWHTLCVVGSRVQRDVVFVVGVGQRTLTQGILPVPIFINGVEAHTIVRDVLTTTHEQTLVKQGRNRSACRGQQSVSSSTPACCTGSKHNPTLRRDAVLVNAVVNTIGFPLVGGPAGTMEGGRQADIARSILQVKNVPYVVAAPLLIQDMGSWVKDGVAGLQSVVLYSLPELDGAIDTVPIGGLVGDDIYLVPERVQRLAERLLRWTALRTKSPLVRSRHQQPW